MTYGELVLQKGLDFEEAFHILRQLTPRRIKFIDAIVDIKQNKQFHQQQKDTFVNQFHAKGMRF